MSPATILATTAPSSSPRPQKTPMTNPTETSPVAAYPYVLNGDINSAYSSSSRSRPTYIGSLILGMKTCLEALHATPTHSQLERWAIFIHESMMICSRNYHSVQHVFDLTEGQTDPILILGAYFHDCIYYHVDGGLSREQKEVLRNVMVPDSGTILLKERPTGKDDDDKLLSMVEQIFGFIQGQPIPEPGLNEFLSAVIAVRELQSVLDRSMLAQIACCIEATIPFRPDNEKGESPMDRLYSRMGQTNQHCSLGMSEDTLIQCVQRAALLGNRDVHNFCTTDRAYFLDNTWALLPETNASLRKSYLYTVQEFQHAMFKMYGFFQFLQPSLIFASFRGVPSNSDMEQMQSEACRNLEIGRQYIGAKLLALSVLSAFAELTGGDAPMSLFMGDLPSRHHVSIRLEDMLPTVSFDEERCDSDVYSILLHGRKTETDFDIRQSPLAAYIYGYMGDGAVKQVVSDVKVYPMDSDKALELLMALPREIVWKIADTMMQVALSRTDKIQAVLSSLPSK